MDSGLVELWANSALSAVAFHHKTIQSHCLDFCTFTLLVSHPGIQMSVW